MKTENADAPILSPLTDVDSDLKSPPDSEQIPKSNPENSLMISNTNKKDAPVGTASAKEVKNVNHENEQTKTAAPAEKKLPGKALDLPASDAIGSSAPAEKKEIHHLETASISTAATHAPHAVEMVEAPEAANPRSHVTEKLVSSILHEVSILRLVKPDKLDVVLRPDSHTQISLQLRVNNGRVEGQARCERGDFALLNSHWNELQRTFDQQGIRLYPLKDPSSGMDFSGSAFSGSPQSQQEHKARQLEELVISEITRTPSATVTATPVSLSKSGNLILQTWA